MTDVPIKEQLVTNAYIFHEEKEDDQELEEETELLETLVAPGK